MAEDPIQAAPAPPSLGRLLFSGTSTLGLATLIERGLGFVANLAAARVGGVQVFGAYSVALTTANNVASYAGAGIGVTANRFSGEYPYGRPGYRALVRALSLFSLGSSALATLILWLAAQPLAVHLLRNPNLTHLLRLAALSAGAIILLECLRGLLVGQRRFAALLTLSILFGGGLVAVLPAAARRGAAAMAVGQAAVALGAVALCVLWAKQLRFAAVEPRGATGATAGLRPSAILKFGSVQLASMIGINAAGWWIASLVARSDTSLVQMGCYSVAMQVRNICGMPPWLISQTAYAQLTEQGGQIYGGPERVTKLSTIAATVVSLLVSGPAIALMPWLMPHVYGKTFGGAELAATLAVATGLIHMSGTPAAARLTVVSLPLTGGVNGIWTLLIVGLGTWLVPRGGAAEAAATFLTAHIVSVLLVLLALLRMRTVSRDLIILSVPALVGSLLLAALGWLRSMNVHKAPFSVAMIVATVLLVWLSLYFGYKTSAITREFKLSQLIPRLFPGAGLGSISARFLSRE